MEATVKYRTTIKTNYQINLVLLFTCLNLTASVLTYSIVILECSNFSSLVEGACCLYQSDYFYLVNGAIS